MPYFSGNRSLHLLPLGASDVGTRFSEGMAGLCDRINAVAGKEIGIEESLVDAQPHTRIRSPWRALHTIHPKTGLWAIRLPWEMVWAAQGREIVEAARRPDVRDWAAETIKAMGFDRPPNPDLSIFYSTLQHFGQLAARGDRWWEANQLKPIGGMLRSFDIDFDAALADLRITTKVKETHCAGKRFTVSLLSRCPGCDESDKAWIGSGGWLNCFRASCEYAEPGVPARGPDGWIARSGLNPGDYVMSER